MKRRIMIEDLTKDARLTEDEMKNVVGGRKRLDKCSPLLINGYEYSHNKISGGIASGSAPNSITLGSVVGKGC